MKRMLVRGFWGDEKIHPRKNNTYREMENKANLTFSQDTVTYVYGKENYDHCSSLGYKCVLVDENPMPYDLIRHHYRHKLEIFRLAMEDYDEVIYIDWDCLPVNEIPSNFWEIMGKKESIQANLGIYRQHKATWRNNIGTARRTIPNAGFVYMRDKSIPDKFIYHWNKSGDKSSAEPPMAKMMDEITNGWCGLEKYWELFEPDLCKLSRKCPFSRNLQRSKKVCFVHYHGGKTRKYQGNKTNTRVKY